MIDVREGIMSPTRYPLGGHQRVQITTDTYFITIVVQFNCLMFEGLMVLSCHYAVLVTDACKNLRLVLVLLLPEPLPSCHQLSLQQVAVASRTEPACQITGCVAGVAA